MINPWRRITLAVLGLAVTLGKPATADDDTGVLLDGVAAYVNRRFITIGEVLDFVAPVAAQLQQHYRGDELAARLTETYQRALRNLLDRALILNAYEQGNTPIPERLLQARIREITFERFGSDREAVWKQLAEEGLTPDEWQQELRNSIIVSVMRDHEVESRIAVSPGELRQEYEASIDRFRAPAQAHLRVIVLPNDAPTDPDHARARLAASLISRLRADSLFEELAREYSEGRRAQEGGDWGWMEVQELRPELAAVAQQLPIDAISEAIVIDQHIYIIQVKGRRHARVTPIEEVYQELERELRRQKANRLYERWIGRLEATAYVRELEIDF